MQECFTVVVKGRELSAVVARQKRRSLRLRLSPQGEIQIEAPLGLPMRKIKAFAEDKHSWLARQLDIAARSTNLPALSPSEAMRLKQELLSEAAPFYMEIRSRYWPETPRRLQARAQKTRWGSCSSSGTISLNVYLMLLPKELREYVYLHELCHLRHPHHQAEFWSDLAILCPDYQARQKTLKFYRLPDAP